MPMNQWARARSSAREPLGLTLRRMSVSQAKSTTLACLAIAGALATGCSGSSDEKSPADESSSRVSPTSGSNRDRPAADAAVWLLGDRPLSTAETFTAEVQRLDCNGGITGRVLPPIVNESESTIVVTFTVAPNAGGAHTCPANRSVPYQVSLSSPIGSRTILDGSCARGGAASTTRLCRRHGGVRYDG